MSTAAVARVLELPHIPFDHNYFNTRFDIHHFPPLPAGLDETQWTIVSKLLAVIREHNLESKVGISLLHNHFHLESGECVVLRKSEIDLTSGDSITDPESVISESSTSKLFHGKWRILPHEAVGLASGLDAFELSVDKVNDSQQSDHVLVPYMLGVNEQGHWTPLQFAHSTLQVPASVGTTMGSLYSQIFCEHKPFLDALQAEITRLESRETFGLFLQYSDVTAMRALKMTLTERTSTQHREQRLFPVMHDSTKPFTATHMFIVGPSDRCITDCDQSMHHTCAHCGTCHHGF